MRLPRRRRWPQRVLGFLATVALLGSGAAIAVMVMPEKEKVAPGGTPGAPVKAGPKSKPALTKAQKRARREAVAKLTKAGYEPVRLSDWRPRAPVKVLIGRSDADAMRAFFFADGEFVGYDDPATSNNVRVVKASGNTVTLAYRLNDDSTAKVRFEWRDGVLAPSEPVPVRELR